MRTATLAIYVTVMAIAYTEWSQVPLACTTADAAGVLGVGINTIRAWLASGRLRGERVDQRKWIVPKAALAEFLGDDTLNAETPPLRAQDGDSINNDPSIGLS